MLSDNYLLPEELRRIADICDAAKPIWDILTTPALDSVSAESDEFMLAIYDSNGEKVGFVTWSDGGPAFYLDNGDHAQPQ
jgi:hypothetical protein